MGTSNPLLRPQLTGVGGGGQLEQNVWRPTKSDLKTSRKGDAPCARTSQECFNNSPKHEMCDICGWPEEEKQEGRNYMTRRGEHSFNEHALRDIRLMDCMSVESQTGSRRLYYGKLNNEQ